MNWIKRLFGTTPPPAQPEVHGVRSIEFHRREVRRFSLALEQCVKGPERKAELRKRLEIAKLQLRAAEMAEGE
jgi:hypothetical protein